MTDSKLCDCGHEHRDSTGTRCLTCKHHDCDCSAYRPRPEPEQTGEGERMPVEDLFSVINGRPEYEKGWNDAIQAVLDKCGKTAGLEEREGLLDEILALTAQVAALRGALEHYADENNWTVDKWVNYTTYILGKHGWDIARAALAKAEEALKQNG